MRCKLLWAFALLVALVGPPSLSADALQTDFEKLKALRIKVLHKGADEKDWAEFRSLRDAFLQRGDLAAKFLIEKLRQMNAEEGTYEKDLNDVEGGLRYVGDEVILHKDGLTKYDICFILADIFPNATSATQSDILGVLGKSYLPSNYGRDDMQFLHFAMWRIGKKAVPTLLDLASNHPAEFVRCGVSSGLNSLREHNQQLTSFPPVLDCNAATQQRGEAFVAWRQWWSEHESEVVVPAMPSFYDIPHEKPTRPASRN